MSSRGDSFAGGTGHHAEFPVLVIHRDTFAAVDAQKPLQLGDLELHRPQCVEKFLVGLAAHLADLAHKMTAM